MTLAREIKKLKRKGFTLVELMLVVVVIAILAAAVMLASDEIVSTSHAARILSNLTEFKKATLAWYADNASIVLDSGFLGVPNPTTGTKNERPSGFRQDTGGASSYGVIYTKDIFPYLKMSGLKIQNNKVVDGYGGEYSTDYATLNEFGTKASNDRYVAGVKDEYIWMIDYKLPNMSEKVKEKLQRKYVDKGLLFWKEPGKSLQYTYGKSKDDNSVGILVLDFSLKTQTRD